MPAPLPPVIAPPPLTAPGPAPVKVAILLPLSGSNAGLGRAMFNAAQLALFDLAENSFTLLPIDTRGSAEGAAQAARQAAGQGVSLLLGPIFSAEVKAAAPVARAAGLSLVSFTTDRSAAGPGVYVMGFLPSQQVERILGFARGQGLQRIGALVPGNDYGRLVADAARGAPIEFYEPGAPDPSPVIRRLAEAAGEGLDAVLIGDEGTRLRNVAALLPSNGIDPARTRLLGTMLWDDPRLGGEPALVGGWYPARSPAARAEFERSYAKAFGAAPPSLASLAYDATALAAVLAQAPRPDFSPAMLTSASGFAGVDGIFRLLPDGTAERGLAVMELTAAGPRVIDPAPESFGATGQ